MGGDKISGVDYAFVYDSAAQRISWSGVGRLREAEDQPIAALLEKAAEARPAELTLDLRELSFLNSGGIHLLSRFLLQVRNLQSSSVTILANQAHPWQRKSLPHLQRLMRGVRVDLDWGS